MNVNDNGCTFCNEFNGRKDLSYFENTFGLKNSIEKRSIFETENFACVPSIGSFVEGYLLLIPKQHFLSSLSMPEAHLKELLCILNILSSFYQDCYHSSYIVYEHGSSSLDNIGGMSVVHAHLHLVPYSSSLLPELNEFKFLRFKDILETRSYYLSSNQNNPYLLFKDTNNFIYFAISENIPSQYFRKKVCDSCGLTGMGDWKEYPFIDNIKRTLATAKKYEFMNKFNDYEGKYGATTVI